MKEWKIREVLLSSIIRLLKIKQIEETLASTEKAWEQCADTFRDVNQVSIEGKDAIVARNNRRRKRTRAKEKKKT